MNQQVTRTQSQNKMIIAGFYLVFLPIAGLMILLTNHVAWLATPLLLTAAALLLLMIPIPGKYQPAGVEVDQELYPQIRELANEECARAGLPPFVTIRWGGEPGIRIISEPGVLNLSRIDLMIGLTHAITLSPKQLQIKIALELRDYKKNGHMGSRMLSEYYDIHKTIGNYCRKLHQTFFLIYYRVARRVVNKITEPINAIDLPLCSRFTQKEIDQAIGLSTLDTIMFADYFIRDLRPLLMAEVFSPVISGYKKFRDNPKVYWKLFHQLDNYEDRSGEKKEHVHDGDSEDYFLKIVKELKKDTYKLRHQKSFSLFKNFSSRHAVLSLEAAEKIYHTLLSNFGLTSIEWNEVAENVILPAWDEAVRESQLHKESLQVWDIYNLVFDSRFDSYILDRPDDDFGEVIVFERAHFWGFFLAVVLWGKGWRGVAVPGESVMMTDGRREVIPEEVMLAIATETMKRGEWAAYCQKNKIEEFTYTKVVA